MTHFPKVVIAAGCGFTLLTCCNGPKIVDQTTQSQTICNPINIGYRFSLEDEHRREAADPTMILYKDKYYLFASKSGGYYSSEDLVSWNLIEAEDLPIEDYAPTVVEMRDTLFFMASRSDRGPTIYKSADPDSGQWEVACDAFPIPMIDPDLFLDDDGRLYFYYGCSDQQPLRVVELDPYTFQPIGKPVDLHAGNPQPNGWERFGDVNELPANPWIEGAWMTKHDGKYYLQYACPGTQFRSYCDGVYVSNNPMGPFTLAQTNPMSYKPGGFIGGAGHSNTFQDKYGNYWHISSMSISVKHMFERRLGLFPVFFDNDGQMYTYTAFGDFPFEMPDHKIEDPSQLKPKYMLLSYSKPVTVSSEQQGHPSGMATDEEIRTYWSAQSGDPGEWITVDLEKEQTVNAVQLNFAENDITIRGRQRGAAHQYLLEYSTDNENWNTLVDHRNNTLDTSHDYFEFDAPVKARYLRITNQRVPDGTFAVSGFRVFGSGNGPLPQAVTEFTAERSLQDPCLVTLRWQKVPDAVGYNIRYGTDKDKLYLNHQLFNTDSLVIRSLDARQNYHFYIDTYNENGITKGTVMKSI